MAQRKRYKPQEDSQLQHKIQRDRKDLIINLLRQGLLNITEIAEIAEISEHEVEQIAQKHIHKKD